MTAPRYRIVLGHPPARRSADLRPAAREGGEPTPPSHGGPRTNDLDTLRRRILAERGAEPALEEVFRYLGSRRLAEPAADWLRWVDRVALRHPLRDLLHSDPYTARAFAQPRGYPGDPEILDHVLAASIPELRHLHPAPSFLRHPIHRYVATRRPSSIAMAGRCRRLAAEIDAVAAARSDCRVLCLAAGRLREAALSEAVRHGSVGQLLALDYDPLTVRELGEAFRGTAVRSLQASVRDLLAWKLRLGSFDLIYAATLFDHLPDRSAAPLLDCLVTMLAPGGRLLLANFVPDHPDQGYLEAYMAWRMVCRDPGALRRLAVELPVDRFATACTMEPPGMLAWLEVTRAG